MAKKKAARSRVRADGWQNIFTKLGDPKRDKRLQVKYSADLLVADDQEELYRGDDMIARIVDTIPDEMTREWFDVCIEGEKSQAEDIMAWLEDRGFQESVRRCLAWERAYGGSGLLLGIDDGQRNLEQPIRPERVRSLAWETVLSPRELYAWSYYDDPFGPRYGEPMMFELTPQFVDPISIRKGGGTPFLRIHESRIIRFPGIQVNRRQMREARGWGDSVITRVLQVVTDFQQAFGSSAALLQDFAQGVYKLKGLAECVASGDADTVKARIELLDLSRSVLRAVVMDSEEDFERKATPVSGLDALLDKFMLRLSAAAEMPVSLLMGQSPAGLQATGSADIRFFYDRIAARQRKNLKPALKRYLTIALNAKDGPTKGKVPANWSIKFNPLWQLDELQKADVRLKTAQADQVYLDRDVVVPEEIRASRWGGDAYSVDTVLDDKLRDEFAAEQDAQAEADHAKAIEAARAQPKPAPPKPGGAR